LALCYGVLFLGRDAVDAMMGEDGVVEYLGALGLLAASALFFVAFLRVRQSSISWIKKLSLLGLALVFFFGGGEEISWGQRILGLETPEGLRDANTQGELNFHNLEVLGVTLKIERLFQAFWVVFAVLVPIACAFSDRARAALARLIPVLPLWIAALFVADQVLAELVEAVLTSNPNLYHGSLALGTNRWELTETLVALLFAVAAWVVLHDVSRERSEASPKAVIGTVPQGR
jgi:hypothetical protein